MDAHQHRFVAKILRYVALSDTDALEAVCGSSDTDEVWQLADWHDSQAVVSELALAGAGTTGGTDRGQSLASVVAFPGASPHSDAPSGEASTGCMFGVSWCPDPHGRVCPDCAEFGPGAAA